jgi:hypothetical protein
MWCDPDDHWGRLEWPWRSTRGVPTAPTGGNFGDFDSLLV